MWRFRAVTCVLGIIIGTNAIAPALAVNKMREFKKTDTQWGTFVPEVAIVPIEQVAFFSGCALIGAAVLVLFAPRLATAAAALASALLWIYFGPQLWARITGQDCFDFSGHCFGATWLQLGVIAGGTAYFILGAARLRATDSSR